MNPTGEHYLDYIDVVALATSCQLTIWQWREFRESRGMCDRDWYRREVQAAWNARKKLREIYAYMER